MCGAHEVYKNVKFTWWYRDGASPVQYVHDVITYYVLLYALATIAVGV